MDEKEKLQIRNNTTVQSNNSRPSSFYDNFKDNNGPSAGNGCERNAGSCKWPSTADSGGDADKDRDRDRSPTQEFLLTTTVPQNLAAANLAGRHAPTRNSLRHSRMIVMNRTGGTGPVSNSYLPPLVQHRRLATVLAAIQTLLGAIICCISAWLVVWTPTLRKRDNPYWSGLPILASGTLGLLFLSCCHRNYPGTLKGYFITGTKIFSVFLSLTATVTGVVASIFALIHILTLAAMVCESKIQLNETCFCETETNATLLMKSYHYADLKCPDVENLFRILLVISCSANALAAIVSLLYVFLYCSNKYGYFYAKVRTKDDNKTVDN